MKKRPVLLAFSLFVLFVQLANRLTNNICFLFFDYSFSLKFLVFKFCCLYLLSNQTIKNMFILQKTDFLGTKFDVLSVSVVSVQKCSKMPYFCVSGLPELPFPFIKFDIEYSKLFVVHDEAFLIVLPVSYIMGLS